MENPPDWQRLGAAVLARRTRLGLRQEDVTAAGGPSHATLRRLERGEAGPYQPRTLATLEKVLRWKTGVVQAILDGSAGDDPETWVQIEAKPGFVVMSHPTLPNQPIQVPDAGVTGHEHAGWRVVTGTASGSLGAIIGAMTGQVGEADGVDAVVRSGQSFIDDVQRYYGTDPEANEVTTAVRTFLKHALVKDLEGDPG